MELFFQFASEQWYWFAALVGLFAFLMWYDNATGAQAVTVHKLGTLLNQDKAKLVDLRTIKAYREGHIPQAENIPYADFAAKVKDYVNKDYPVIFVCQYGQQSSAAGAQIKKAGGSMDNVYKLRGGMSEWFSEKLPVSKGAN